MPEPKLTVEQMIDAIEHFEPEELSLLEEQLKQRQSELHPTDTEGNPVEPSKPGVSVPKNFPPKIQELLKKKGWNWPPDEKLKTQMREAAQKFIGSVHTGKDVLKEVHKDFPGRFPDDGSVVKE